MLEYVHFVPGRLRLKNSDLRDKQRAAEAEGYAAAIPFVKGVVANPITGSLTINFEKDEFAIRDLWIRLCARGYAAGPCPDASATRLAFTPDRGGDWLGRVLVTAILEAIVQRSAQTLVRALL
jgi:hypothetical protein